MALEIGPRKIAQFTPQEIGNAQAVINSFLPGDGSYEVLGTVGFLALEFGTLLPENVKTVPKPETLGSREYSDARTVFDSVRRNSVNVHYALAGQYINPGVVDQVSTQIGQGEKAAKRKEYEADLQRRIEKYGHPFLENVGWGPFPLPGEKKRLRRIYEESERELQKTFRQLDQDRRNKK